MAGIDVLSLAMANTYTDETVVGGGAIKGSPCYIKSKTAIEGGNRVTFGWTLEDGTEKTAFIDVMNGTKGEDGEKGAQGDDGRGIKHSYVNQNNHFIIVYDDDTEEDMGEITVLCVDTLNELNDVEIDEPTDGQVLKFNSESGKWENGEGGTGGDSSLSSDVTSNITVGAILSGTTLQKGTTFTEFAQKLLISEIAPTITFSMTKSGNVVYGQTYIEELSVSCTAMGTAKQIKSIAWYEGNTLKQTDAIESATTGTWKYLMQTGTTDTTTFKAFITYVKSDNTETSVAKTSTISFYYNKFYGSVGSLTPDEATVEALTAVIGTTKGGTYKFTTSAARICYAYPKSLGALTSIKDGNGFSLFDSFTRTEVTYTQNYTSVEYYRYVLTDATTVSGYSVVFA